MKHFSMENLTELSHDELVNVQGGGLLEDYVAKLTELTGKAIDVLKQASAATATFLKSLIDALV